MSYNKADFLHLRTILNDVMKDGDGDWLSCQLHQASMSSGMLYIEYEDGNCEPFHVAEACNIADVITSIDRLLALPRSNLACRELAEVLLLRMDILREYVATAIKRSPQASYNETEADNTIRRWAGFLKHPSDYIFAHRCFSDLDLPFASPIIIDNDFLAKWDSYSTRERDKQKEKLSNELVTVRLPSVEDIVEFIQSTSVHILKFLKCSGIPTSLEN
jgi:hypothetical protein